MSFRSLATLECELVSDSVPGLAVELLSSSRGHQDPNIGSALTLWQIKSDGKAEKVRTWWIGHWEDCRGQPSWWPQRPSLVEFTKGGVVVAQ